MKQAPLMNAQEYMHGLETAYREIWDTFLHARIRNGSEQI